jgi:hypothetical protein
MASEWVGIAPKLLPSSRESVRTPPVVRKSVASTMRRLAAKPFTVIENERVRIASVLRAGCETKVVARGR